jgi:DNA-binding transcriptional regulator WhiA
MSAAIGERIIREVRQHVSREMKAATKRVLKTVRANSKDIEALWRALASERK